MSMKELARACGVTPMAISNYESGKRKPDMDTINKLAEALGVYVVDCLMENPLPPAPKCHVLKSTGDYEKDAEQLRKALGLPIDGPIDELVTVLENKGIMVLELDIDNEHFFGMNGFVNDYPYIVINTNMRSERKRTTILHELAHLMFVWDPNYENENEKAATAIAGATLISKNDLLRELGLRKSAITKDMALVCREYGISMYLLVKRASMVGIISDYTEKDFYITANKNDYKKREPSRVKAEEKPLLFRQLVYRAVSEEGISIQRGAELLRIPVDEMEEFCGLMEV